MEGSRSLRAERHSTARGFFWLSASALIVGSVVGTVALWPATVGIEAPATPRASRTQLNYRGDLTPAAPLVAHVPDEISVPTLARARSEPELTPANLENTPVAAYLTPGETLKTIYPDGLIIESLGQQGSRWTGLRKVPFDKLPEAVQRQFHYDPQRAAEYRAEQARWMATYRADQLRAAAPETTEQDKVEVLAALLSDYQKSHTYSLDDRFVCADMACEVWNMVRTKGFPAKIQIGNVDRDPTTIDTANHAWVLADVSQGKWLALETTAGRVVFHAENPRYYRGWSFGSPRKYKEFCLQHSVLP